MNRNTLWLFVVILIVYFTLTFANDAANDSENSTDFNALQTSGRTDLMDEARTRRHRHRLWHMWGWHALAIAYWVKVKLVIVGFFVGSAVFVALRYVWPHKCASSDIIHEGPIVYDHPPSFGHHDHTPYSFDHSPNFEHPYPSSSSGSFDPYSGYAGYSEDITATAEVVPSTAPETHRIGRRSVRQQTPQNHMKTEERIAEFMFDFLGLDSKACRRRFVCEMEFRSRLNPISSMAFRIVGRGFFEKYTNARNELGRAHSFAECAVVNAECVFIEENFENEEDVVNNENENSDGADSEFSSVHDKHENKIDQSSAESHNSNDANTNTNLEAQNEVNLKAERRLTSRRRQRGDRKVNMVAERILAQRDSN